MTLTLAMALVAPLAAPVAAQETQLSGTVAEVFGTQMVLTTSDGRLLVTLPEGTAAPAPGTALTLTGTRTGDTFAAATLSAGTAAPVADEATLPAPLRGLGLSDIRTRRDDDGDVYLYARTATGWLRAEARGDRLHEVQGDGAGLPPDLIAAMLPAPARDEPRLTEIARMTEIEVDDDGEISVEGFAADGMRIEMEFARDGVLQGFERETDDRRSMTEAAARDRLAALGYRDVGFVERGGRHVTAIATNPSGDVVEVRLDDQGRVERERLWLN
ncbi:prevent-host-death protein [Rhodobacter sp. CCP-1]|uniref:Prevent-host-death protein n=1 Tax=Paragemmobacter ruber TaxID=1985673 RepID=A0ABW9Y928_9RHOB|nr:prevent-host-death protein [Rhodobacter ruber]